MVAAAIFGFYRLLLLLSGGEGSRWRWAGRRSNCLCNAATLWAILALQYVSADQNEEQAIKRHHVVELTSKLYFQNHLHDSLTCNK